MIPSWQPRAKVVWGQYARRPTTPRNKPPPIEPSLFIWPLLLWVHPALARSSTLGHTGETIGGAVVLEVIEHPEFQQLRVRLPDERTLTIEATATPEPRGACTHGGISIQPRWELLGIHDAQQEDQPAVVRALCERLAQTPAPPTLAPPSSEGTSSASDNPHARPTQAERPKLQWLHGVVAAMVALVAVWVLRFGKSAYRRLTPTDRREVVAWTALGLVLRWGLGLWAILWAPNFGFGRLTMALNGHSSELYGGGFAALTNVVPLLFGPDPRALYTAQVLLGTLAIPLVWSIARHLLPHATLAPGVSAALMAFLPIHVYLSATETMHISVVTIEALAVWAAASFVRTASTNPVEALVLAALSGVSTGFVAHLRPEAIPFVLVPPAWVLLSGLIHSPATFLRTRRVPLALAALCITGLVGLRWLEMQNAPIHSPSDPRQYLSSSLYIDVWNSLWVAPTEARVLLTPFSLWLTPLLVPLLAVLACVPMSAARPARLPPHMRAAALWVWFIWSMLPVIPKAWPIADAYRLQLPAWIPVALLVGIGAEVLWSRWPQRLAFLGAPRRAASVLLAAVLLLRGVSQRPDSGVFIESQLLARSVLDLPSGTVFAYDADANHIDGVVSWILSVRDGLEVVPMHYLNAASPDATPRSIVVWLGAPESDGDPSAGHTPMSTIQARRDKLRERCTLTPLWTETIATSTEVGQWRRDQMAEIGMYRAEGCDIASGNISPSEPPSN